MGSGVGGVGGVLRLGVLVRDGRCGLLAAVIVPHAKGNQPRQRNDGHEGDETIEAPAGSTDCHGWGSVWEGVQSESVF